MTKKITIENTIFTVGNSADSVNWAQEELPVTYSVMKTEDGLSPVITLLGKDFPKAEIQRMLSIMDKIEELSDIVGEDV